jgi:Listeria-Bacteroides repeat domain (List_Bact_rpt).
MDQPKNVPDHPHWYTDSPQLNTKYNPNTDLTGNLKLRFTTAVETHYKWYRCIQEVL